DPINPNLLYAADSDLSVNGTAGTGNLNSPTAANPGVWRWDGAGWINLTDVPSNNRNNTLGQAPFGSGPPRTPGPDDDYRILFPQRNAAWSDLSLIGGVLY